MASADTISQKSEAGSAAAEPLRALRRGLARADGFGLYIAVVKTPSQRNQLISLLAEALPAVKLQTVTIGKEATDILDEIHRQLGGKITGPVMVVGFEEVLSSDTQSHPILNSLNLRRSDWPQSVPQPVVFWLPEYLLGLFARSAPDFLDWRSDTLHFPKLAPAQFRILESATWDHGLDTRMPADARHERIKELESRVAANEHNLDPVVRSTVADWLNELGLHLMLFGRIQEAIDCFQKTLSIAHALDDNHGECAALGNLGNAFADLSEFSEAIDYYERALALSHEIGDRHEEVNSLNNLGKVHWMLGDMHKAIQFHEQQRGIANAIGDRRAEIKALGNLGVVYNSLGDLHKAIEFFNQALAIARDTSDQSRELACLNNLGLAHHTLGEINASIGLYKEALLIARKIGDRLMEGTVLNNLGNALARLDETSEARKYYQQALAIAREIGDRHGEGNALWNSATADESLGNHAEAIPCAEAALKIFRAIGDPNAAKVRAKLAEWRAGAS